MNPERKIKFINRALFAFLVTLLPTLFFLGTILIAESNKAKILFVLSIAVLFFLAIAIVGTSFCIVVERFSASKENDTFPPGLGIFAPLSVCVALFIILVATISPPRRKEPRTEQTQNETVRLREPNEESKKRFLQARQYFVEGKHDKCLDDLAILHADVFAYENSKELVHFCALGSQVQSFQNAMKSRVQRDQAVTDHTRQQK